LRRVDKSRREREDHGGCGRGRLLMGKVRQDARNGKRGVRSVKLGQEERAGDPMGRERNEKTHVNKGGMTHGSSVELNGREHIFRVKREEISSRFRRKRERWRCHRKSLAPKEQK